MIISHSKRFIFIHIYKNAGTSIRRALNRYNNPSFKRAGKKDKLRFLFGIYPKIFSNDYPGHITAKELKDKLSDKIFDKYYTFAIVRNPWDWQVSMFRYMLEDKTHYQHKLAKSFRNFDEYIEWRIDNNYKLQKDFIFDKHNNCLINFVGRFENIQSDFAKICENLKIKTVTLGIYNTTKHQHYRKYYNEYTKKLIEEAFKEDIETFNYHF